MLADKPMNPKQERSNGYYSTASYFLSKIIGDLIPMRIIPAFLFGTIIYFMVGFQLNAGKYFFNILALFCTTFAGTALAFAISSYIEVFALGTLMLGGFYLIMMVFGGLFLNLNTSKSIAADWFVGRKLID
jgi:ATP-binding cassette subfamily G (WHITE) protein 2